MLALSAFLATAAFAVGGTPLKPADILDGRTIASGDGRPVVMITLSPQAAKRIARGGPVTIDGKPVTARIAEAVIEIDGAPDFAAAKALAKRIAGKDPLPELEGE